MGRLRVGGLVAVFGLVVLWVAGSAGATVNPACATSTGEPGASITSTSTTCTYTYTHGSDQTTGSAQTFTVPTGVTSVTVDAVGGYGGSWAQTSADGTGRGGPGGEAIATLSVTPGDSLYVDVGGHGAVYGVGGWNGGGSDTSSSLYDGGGGGGASDVRTIAPGASGSLGSRLVVAGGGGGSGAGSDLNGASYGGNGGAGGSVSGSGTNGDDGSTDPLEGGVPGGGGFGATQSTYGKHGSGACGYGSDGSLGQGGTAGIGATACQQGGWGGGGGGGGLYGGGGGGNSDAYSSSGGGGGGSSWATPSATNVSYPAVTLNAPASVRISYTLPSNPDLAVTVTGSPSSSVLSGDQLTYTITATNTGDATATGVQVTDTLPDSVHFDSATASQGTCTHVAHGHPKTKDGTVTCDLGSLDGGASATVTIVVITTTPGTLTNTASATATGVTSDPDDSDTVNTTVVGT